MEILGIHFLQPLFLYGIVFIPIVLIAIYFLEKKQQIAANFLPDIDRISSARVFLLFLKNTILVVILLCFVLLFADPHTAHTKKNVSKNGIDIVLALDISKSMDAVDLKPNRIEKAKETIISFLEDQETNRIGLVVFAGKPLSSVPLTFDYNILKETLTDLSTDTLNQQVSGLDGTAVGDALLMGKNLFESKTDLHDKKQKKEQREQREKVVILLTDGDANRGVEPPVAAKLLKSQNIKVYTIGIGSKKGGTITVNNGLFMQELQIPPMNTEGLKKVANITGGHFFRASDNNSLTAIFEKLGELEKHDIDIEVLQTFSEDYSFFVYVLLSFVALLFVTEIFIIKT